METYGKILLIAMPAFFVLVLFEKFWGVWKGNDTVPVNDMIASLSSGITNVTKDVLGLSIVVISYEWMAGKFGLFQIDASWLTYVIAFIALDFAGYWVHRISHEYNLFWNNHIIHHSSEEFNLACALRQSISSIVKIFGIFLLPAALLGVPAQVIAIVAPLHLFAQFWYHTRHIGKMGFLEKIIVTPSHHRVHHAINPEYLDKNYGQIFIIWDKLFGTYQEEQENVPAVYGVTRPVRTWNPIKINFMHLWLLIKDAWRAQDWKDKLKIWFMPLGWRPKDVAEKYPVFKIEDVYHFQKYNPFLSKGMLIWSFAQLIVLLLLLSYLFGNLASIGVPDIFYYGAFVFLTVYSYTELMDRNPNAWVWEVLKVIYAFYFIFTSGDWFGINQILPGALTFFIVYLFSSCLLSVWFCLKNERMQLAN
ncbi:MAG TPA: sterol desaturase [Algoriphagus sp.]|jgi:sterol desaturase/sphingolipid hydroxylase (fatty acid hydroxylase superfamily)|uniref:sterol desaturase family protein n=3 Tax=unclassified Algoriphagus TaxID=2641541 RepID=UPI000C53D401|nr:sterol desaturase family protein [Algoriphagus sp.]MAL12009.1 sterol desaturase [Algoriphagus sp.]HAD52518.1 sterol desaturase [Algoriphagus sp.]HAH38579.1 sterol desaturase [Algoriphagus sp.]HCB45389.1 sterol desaturase [Algoriphagus sp.]HCD87648.1 sterol desaturase [Algoriphagus sp.]|tara:strand:+ start:13728 stop:14987 length:1260 start_codon:yes stop_codon:yes gene_type:complete